MINLTITRYASGGIGPWNFLFYDAANQGCVTFSPASGLSDSNGKITTVATFINEACLLAADIRLYAESQSVNPAERCINTVAIPITSPCTGIQVEGIQSTGFTFSVNPLPTGTFNYTWSYDTLVFELQDTTVDTNAPTLALKLKSNSTPPNTPISVIVEDYFGCRTLVNLNYVFQQPVAYEQTVPLYCLREGERRNDSVFLDVQSLNPIDWTTLSFGITAAQISLQHPYGDNPTSPVYIPENWIKVSSTAIEAPGTYPITYTVRDIYGLISSIGTLFIVVPDCTFVEDFYIPDYTAQLYDVTAVAGDVVDIVILNMVYAAGDVAWDSLTFTDSGTAQTATVVGEANGYDDVVSPNVTYSPNARTIHYEIPDIGPTDSFSFYMEDTLGNLSNTATFYINLNAVAPPTTVADTATVACNSSVLIDLLANDTPGDVPINPASIEIVAQPQVGTLVTHNNGTVTFYAPEHYSGTVTFTYRVSDNNTGESGQVGISNTSTVTIQIICAGENANISTCQ